MTPHPIAVHTRRSVLGRASATAGLVASGLSGAAHRAAAQGTRVTYVTPSGFVLGNVDVMYGEAAGHYARAGLDLNVLPGRGTVMAAQQVIAGTAQMSRTGGIDLIRAVSGERADLICFGTSHAGDVYRIISTKERPIRTPAEMRGKLIGIASQGGSTEMLLNMMLVQAGVDPTTVQRQVVGFAPGTFALVEAGRLAAYIGSTSTVMQLRLIGKEPVEMNTDDHAPAPAQVFVTTNRMVAEQPDLLARFLRATHASIGELLTAPLPDVLGKVRKYDVPEFRTPEVLEPIARHTIEILAPAHRARMGNDPRLWEATLDLMMRTGLIANRGARVMTNEIVERAFG